LSSIQLDIVTPERKVYSQDIKMVIARAKSGELGVLPGHTPILATLIPGVMRVKVNDTNEERIAVSGGFLEVSKERITVLARTAELRGEIDVSRAEAALNRAEERLQKSQEKVDYARAQAALDRAVARLNVAREK